LQDEGFLRSEDSSHSLVVVTLCIAALHGITTQKTTAWTKHATLVSVILFRVHLLQTLLHVCILWLNRD